MTLEAMLIAFKAMMVSADASMQTTRTTILGYPIAVIGSSTNLGTSRNSANQVFRMVVLADYSKAVASLKF